MAWNNIMGLSARTFTCGFCGNLVASAAGWVTGQRPQRHIYVCPNCDLPTLFTEDGAQVPGVIPGNEVGHLPADIQALYRETRRCISVGSYTSSVLACRKLLMNIAVAQGAKEGESFISYIEYLAKAGFVPPNGRGWVDHIRSKGNEATHEIRLMNQPEALELISFAEMLLKFVYEFPSKVPPAPTTPIK